MAYDNPNFIPASSRPLLNAQNVQHMQHDQKSANPGRQAPKFRTPQELERQQRLKEYRIAARREKRNRKSDEKKQRKLNATILRRMTKNPAKYTKNKDRNRERAILLYRRDIYKKAIEQAQRLAFEHDRSGKSFNVGPVTKVPDTDEIITIEALEIREKRLADKQARDEAAAAAGPNHNPFNSNSANGNNGITPERQAQILILQQMPGYWPGMSNRQQKKLLLYAPQPIPPRPIIPEGISLPEGETDWGAEWDISDNEIDRRLKREKRDKVTTRKEFRRKQQAGKAERRMARDEKRKVYRELKDAWKAIKAKEKANRSTIRVLEDQLNHQLAMELNDHDRLVALHYCDLLGFTLANTDGVNDIKPTVTGLKGIDFDWDDIEIGEGKLDFKIKRKAENSFTDNSNPNLTSLGPRTSKATSTATASQSNFISFAPTETTDLGSLNYKIRKKLQMSLDRCELEKEKHVRERALEYLTEHGMTHPPQLLTELHPKSKTGKLVLPNGLLETDKQLRIRARVELAEFNKFMKVLRAQAKEQSIYAGLKKYADAMAAAEEREKEELARKEKEGDSEEDDSMDTD
ncbi:MAG: hypothetical protein M1814_000587 [Vezdaea aestivalis]|nr:MAG: hypothetical protein M1814_000587 [Vezdaea aestivalis]